MRLYSGQVPVIAKEVLRTLLKEGDLDIDTENVSEVELDIQAVLREYIRMDRDLTERARDMAARREGGYSNLGRIKRKLARDKNFAVGEDGVEYIIDQLIETFFHSTFVDEVFAEDNDLRRHIAVVIRKHVDKEDELDREVKKRIRNLEEGSEAWDIEYQKAMENLKRSQNLE